MTHCDAIAALSDQFPIKVSLEIIFIRFIKKCLSSSNSIVNVISYIAICNPMSTAAKNYKSVLDANGDYNTNQMVTSWQYTCESIKESITCSYTFCVLVSNNCLYKLSLIDNTSMFVSSELSVSVVPDRRQNIILLTHYND